MTAPLIIGVALFSAVTAGEVPNATPTSPARTPLELKLPIYPSGKIHDLAQDRGNVVLLDIWATWCIPCQRAFPLYEKLVKQYGARGFTVYAINVDEDSRQLRKFMKETKLRLPVLIDRHVASLQPKLGIRMMPISFVLDKRGLVRHVHEGAATESLEKFQSEIEALLSE
jgi:thiol-disulfide isomerase/thioredoxin